MTEASPHERTVELLPWLANDTLEGDERDAVEAHLAGCADCREELTATRDALRTYAAHLPMDAILAYAEDPDATGYPVAGEGGRTHVLDRALVERHVEQCEHCRDEVEMTRESLSALDAGDAAAERSPAGVVPLERRAAETPEEEWRGAPLGPVMASSATASGAPRWLPFALAASLLLAIVAAGGWFVDHQRVDQRQARLAELEAELDAARAAADDARRAGGTAAPGTAAGDADAALARYEQQLEDLQERMAALSSELEAEQGQVADLRAELAQAGRPVRYREAIVADVMLDVTRGAADSTLRAEPGLLFTVRVVDGGGLLTAGEPVTYRLLGSDGNPVLEAEATPRPDPLGYGTSIGIPLDPAALPSGRLRLQILDGDEMLNEFPVRFP